MKRNISACIAALALTTVILQYYLMIQNGAASIPELTIRFFSYFTILTNSLVALFFTFSLIEQKSKAFAFLDNPGSLTALTVYIAVVGFIYQVILRHTWSPTGLQRIVDESLHTVIPVVVIAFWYYYEAKELVNLKQIPQWLIYPLAYLIYVLVRGSFSGFYPYPFVDVTLIGIQKVMINSTLITLLFVLFSIGFVKIGKIIKK